MFLAVKQTVVFTVAYLLRSAERSNNSSYREASCGCWAHADETATLYVDNLVAVPDRARTMRDDKAGARGDQPVERVDDGRLGSGVDRAGRLVEDQDRRVLQNARASEMRWRSPPDNVSPRSPTGVS